MIAPPVLLQWAFCTLKKTDWPKLDSFKFLILDVLNAQRVNAELQLEGQSKPMGLFGIELIIFDRLWEQVDFSTIPGLTSHLPSLFLADSSHLPSDEAYRQRLSLPCNSFSKPCYKPKVLQLDIFRPNSH
jgi:hypothetical protein